MKHYVISVIPDAQKQATNRLIAAIEGEDLLSSENLSQPANSSGAETDPFTHWYGGRWAPEPDPLAWLTRYQGLGADLALSGVAFPLVVEGAVVLTAEEAQAAAQALVITVTTSDEEMQQPQQTLAAAMDALGLKPIQWE